MYVVWWTRPWRVDGLLWGLVKSPENAGCDWNYDSVLESWRHPLGRIVADIWEFCLAGARLCSLQYLRLMYLSSPTRGGWMVGERKRVLPTVLERYNCVKVPIPHLSIAQSSAAYSSSSRDIWTFREATLTCMDCPRRRTKQYECI
jgi:hypothetical protein